MTAPQFVLTLPAEADNVAVVRQALAGLAEAIGLDEVHTADLKTVVSEACMNVVVHAYPERDGPMEISTWPDGDQLRVVVRDEGIGFQPRPADESGPARLRLGLPLIAALSDGFEIRGGPGRGTEVRITKRLAPNERTETTPVEATEDTALRFAPGAPVQPVLGRVLGALAARANLSIDRLSDSQLLADAVSAQALSEGQGEPLSISIADSAGMLELHVDPLVEGGVARLLDAMEIPGPPIGSLRSLASEIRAEPLEGGGERLVIAIGEAAEARG